MLLASGGGLTLLTCGCAFDGFLLSFLLVSACPLLRLFVTGNVRKREEYIYKNRTRHMLQLRHAVHNPRDNNSNLSIGSGSPDGRRGAHLEVYWFQTAEHSGPSLPS